MAGLAPAWKAASLFRQANLGQFRERAGELAWVAGGKALLIGSTAVLHLLLARVFDVVTYGLMVTVIGMQLFLSRVLTLGVDNGMIRFRSLEGLRHQQDEVVRAGLQILLATSAIAFLVILTIAPSIKRMWDPGWPDWILAATGIGAAGTALLDYAYAHHLSRLHYRSAALLQSGNAIWRLFATMAAVVLAPGRTALTFFVYSAAPLVCASAFVPWSKLRRTPGRASKIATRLLRFSVWQGGADATSVLFMYQGTFLLGWLGLRAETGPYGLALTVSLGFTALSQAFSQFLYPRMVLLQHPGRLPYFLLRTGIAALGLIVLLVPVVAAIGMALPIFLGPAYKDVTPVIYWLAGAALLSLLHSPLIGACIYMLRPGIPLVIGVLRVLYTLGFGFALAPSGGAKGVAIAQFAGASMALLTLLVAVMLALRIARRDNRLLCTGNG